MNELNFYYYATCKCQAPEAWHALNRYASAHGGVGFRYVQTQSGPGADRINALLGPGTVAHPPYIGKENGPLALVSALTDEAIAATVKMTLA